MDKDEGAPRRKRGAPKRAVPGTRVLLIIDTDVLDYFRRLAGDGNKLSRTITAALRRHMEENR